jgi:hypothetical protein
LAFRDAVSRISIPSLQKFAGEAVCEDAAFDLPSLEADWMSNIFLGVGYGASLAILDESPALLGRPASLRRRRELGSDDLLRLRQGEEGSSQSECSLRMPRS